MGTGIVVCGLNGCGKSTLGRALADALGFHFIDNEDLYFPKTDPDNPFASPRSQDEVARLLLEEAKTHENFVFSSVRGNYGAEILPYYRYAVLLAVPKEIRMQRIRDRSFRKFGSRALPGGDLYPQEKAFFDMAEARSEDYAEKWLSTLFCPILRVDGTGSVAEKLDLILRWLKGRPLGTKRALADKSVPPGQKLSGGQKRPIGRLEEGSVFSLP
ncbi:MAG: AAA family ATPase [Ruminococcus flavefaciens]|nr:AAA family ATPase [Ruminococcus flavefaciens]